MPTFTTVRDCDVVYVEGATKRDALVRHLTDIGVADIDPGASLEDLLILNEIPMDEVELVEAGVPVRYHPTREYPQGRVGTVDVWITEGLYRPLENKTPGTWAIALENWTGGYGDDKIYRGSDWHSPSSIESWQAFRAEVVYCRYASRSEAVAGAKRWIAEVRKRTVLDTPGRGLEF